jgi:hypothetical protein
MIFARVSGDKAYKMGHTTIKYLNRATGLFKLARTDRLQAKMEIYLFSKLKIWLHVFTRGLFRYVKLSTSLGQKL